MGLFQGLKRTVLKKKCSLHPAHSTVTGKKKSPLMVLHSFIYYCYSFHPYVFFTGLFIYLFSLCVCKQLKIKQAPAMWLVNRIKFCLLFKNADVNSLTQVSGTIIHYCKFNVSHNIQIISLFSQVYLSNRHNITDQSPAKP